MEPVPEGSVGGGFSSDFPSNHYSPVPLNGTGGQLLGGGSDPSPPTDHLFSGTTSDFL